MTLYLQFNNERWADPIVNITRYVFNEDGFLKIKTSCGAVHAFAVTEIRYFCIIEQDA